MSTERRYGRNPGCRLPACAGVSLIEVILFILVIGIALAALVNVFMVANRGSADPALYRQSLAIAQAFVEEIRGKDYANPPGGYANAPCNEDERNLFDDVMDYDGYDRTGVADLGNVAIAGLAGYRVRVAVAQAALGAVPLADGRRFTVTVTDPAGNDTVLEGYRANY
jgi:MSHA pilin protein MshD